MKKSRFSALLLAVLTLAGCTGTTEQPDNTSISAGTGVPEVQILTNVFEGESFVLPESSEKIIQGEIKPYYDSETGTYTMLTCTEESETYSLVTFDSTGMPVIERELTFSDELRGISDGAVTQDGAVVRLSAYSMTGEITNSLVRVTDNGEIVRTEDLSVLFGLDATSFYNYDYAVDADGWTYLLTTGEVFVLDEQLLLQFSVPCDADTLTAVNGTVFAGTSYGISPIDKTSRSLDEMLSLPEGVSAEACFPGNGFTLCWRTTEGIFGASEDGTYELLMSFQNSGLIPYSTDVLHIAGRDDFLLYDGSETAIYRRAADIDLSDVTVIDLAYTGRSNNFLQQVVEFNKTHHDIRIVTKDYNVYVNGNIREDEESMLSTDMLTGVYRPDIFFTVSDSSRELSFILSNNLFLDLYSFLETDEAFCRDDLFGCIKRTYETEDGQLAAICSNFRVETLIGGTEILEGRKSWTLAEMVEYAQSLPEDVSFMPELAANRAEEMLLGVFGYAAFVDLSTSTCSFDTPEFHAYLEFLATLPEKFDYSIYENVSRQDFLANTTYAVQSKAYTGVFSWVTDKLSSVPEITRIGYASENSGSYIKASPYVITSFCEEPEAAWTFVREILLNDFEDAEEWEPMGGNFPSMKAVYEEAAKHCQKYVYRQRNLRLYDPENPPTDADGPYTFFTEEDSAELAAWLDEDVGVPYSGILPDEITDIVEEEISAYLGGVRTAEACADIIQSRVSLWLSEHE